MQGQMRHYFSGN